MSSLDPVRLRLETWKRQLLDLSLRNRLLNYRPTKVTTLEIVDEHPTLIFKGLMDGRSYRFGPLPDSDDDASDDEEEPQPELEIIEAVTASTGEAEVHPREFKVGQDFESIGGGELPAHHVDRHLQTRHYRDKLEKNLVAIHRKAQSSLDEQGVNTLYLALGMLEWYESDDSDEPRKAPILLFPVVLSRETAAARYVLSRGDDEPVMNPALVEKMRLDFGLKLPDLPELTDELDVDAFLLSVREAVDVYARWRLTSDIALSLFSFQKFLMYRDLERHEERFRQHPMIKSLSRESGEEIDGGGNGALPENLAGADLDEAMGPWEIPQVLDADSSQQRAIFAALRDSDLVVEGPPGTGKSQTITNLIAAALAERKKVLFVSEKMAALEVVKTRLESTGLGDFVLELHGHKVRKTEFVEELGRALDADVPCGRDHTADFRRLQTLVRTLKGYVTALHAPHPVLGISAYEGIGRFFDVKDAPELVVHYEHVTSSTAEEIEAAENDLRNLGIVLGRIGPPRKHALRGIGLEDGSRVAQAEVRTSLDAALDALSALVDAMDEVMGRVPVVQPHTFGEARDAIAAGRHLLEEPTIDPALTAGDAWADGRPDSADDLLCKLGEYDAARTAAHQLFMDDIFGDDSLEEATTTYGRGLEHGVWRWFMPSYWSARSALRKHLKPKTRAAADELLAGAQTALRTREKAEWLSEHGTQGKTVFARHWLGTETDLDEVRAIGDWLEAGVEHRSADRYDLVALSGYMVQADDERIAEDLKLIGVVESALTAARRSIASFAEATKLDTMLAGVSADEAERIGSVGLRLTEVDGAIDDLPDWARHNRYRAQLRESVAAPFITAAVEKNLDPASYEASFRRSFYDAWVNAAVDGSPELREFFGDTHEEGLRQYRSLDSQSFKFAREQVRGALANQRQELLNAALQSETQFINVQARKRRNIAPVRKILSRAPSAVQTIKPCFMMSPLSVAQFLEPENLHFDLLVFDEASQIRPSDAVGAFIRADQIIVVGDSRQLPPTNFFDVQMEEEELDEVLEVGAGLESILDEVAVSGTPRLRLRWHYRSLHESLIRFSNEEFYADDPLMTFPHANRTRDDLGLQFEFLQDAYYAGKGRNPREATAVAQGVVQHIKTQAGRPEHERESLGVGTFGIKQADLILDELDRLRREDPSIEWFFDQEGENAFFVKNLENIQGDDRDIIFLSVTYGPDQDGNLSRNFGPINSDGGSRRLNVLTTRAKKRLRIFSTMRGSDIDPTGVSPNVEKLARYLTYAETGKYPMTKRTLREPDSPFERKVIAALKAHDYAVVPQVGEGGYRIDLAIVDPEAPGRYVCGIECDGAAYHSAATVRDRDRLRQHVLELRGWTIHRVWSTDWFKNPRAQTRRLIDLIEKTRSEQIAGHRGGAAAAAPALPTTPLEEPVEEHGRVPIEEIPIAAYEEARLGQLGAPSAFYDTSLRRLRTIAESVLDVEGPIHTAEAARRIAAAYGMERAGRRIVGRVQRSLAALVQVGRARKSGPFYWLVDKSIPVRHRGDEGPQDAELIAREEVEAAILLLLEYRAPLIDDEIVTETTRLLGYQRTGSKLRTMVEEARDRLVADGALRPGSRGIRLQ